VQTSPSGPILPSTTDEVSVEVIPVAAEAFELEASALPETPTDHTLTGDPTRDIVVVLQLYPSTDRLTHLASLINKEVSRRREEERRKAEEDEEGPFRLPDDR
jgi:hypothetical protein